LIKETAVATGEYSRVAEFLLTTSEILLLGGFLAVYYVTSRNRLLHWQLWREQMVATVLGTMLAVVLSRAQYHFSEFRIVHGFPLATAFELLNDDGSWTYYTDPLYSMNVFANVLLGLWLPYVPLSVLVRYRVVRGKLRRTKVP
jgi:hypothetical protein